MFGAEGELEKEDCEGAFEVVHQHPPHCAFVENGGVGFVKDKAEGGACGGDAIVC